MRHISQVAANPAPSYQETPTQLTASEAAPRVTDGRSVRRARNMERRAARRAGHGPGDTLWIAQPTRFDAKVQRIVEARRHSWRRRSEALAAIQSGNYAEARAALHDLLTTEASIQCDVESIQVSDRWGSVAGELWRASHAAKKAIREQLAALDLYPVGECPTDAVTHITAGQSDWLQAWRTFTQVMPAAAR